MALAAANGHHKWPTARMGSKAIPTLQDRDNGRPITGAVFRYAYSKAAIIVYTNNLFIPMGPKITNFLFFAISWKKLTQTTAPQTETRSDINHRKIPSLCSPDNQRIRHNKPKPFQTSGNPGDQNVLSKLLPNTKADCAHCVYSKKA